MHFPGGEASLLKKKLKNNELSRREVSEHAGGGDTNLLLSFLWPNPRMYTVQWTVVRQGQVIM